jgi:hypothetical protein
MNRGVDHVCRRVEQTAWASVDDLALVVYEDQIRGLDQTECDTKGVHPEGCGVDRVLAEVSGLVAVMMLVERTYTQGDMSGNAFIVSVLAENTECGGQPALEICSLLVRVVKLGRAREHDGLHPRLFLVQPRLKGSSIAWLCLAAILRLNCRGRRHVKNVVRQL